MTSPEDPVPQLKLPFAPPAAPMILALLAACGADPVADSAEAPTIPSAWAFDASADRGPPLSAEAVEAAFAPMLGELLSFHGADVVALYQDRLALEQGGCPYTERTETRDPDLVVSDYWFADGCTTEGGVYFSGHAYARAITDYALGDQLSYDGFDFKGEGMVIDGEGQLFIFGGFAYLIEGASRFGDAEAAWSTGVQGSVTWTGQDHDGAWFTTSRAAELAMDARRESGRLSLSVEGGVAGFEGALEALVAQPLVARDDSACPEELGGVVKLRDADGRWYTLSFDGATEAGQSLDLSRCDGCGELSLDGEALGQVCASPAPLLDWQSAPW